MQSQTEAMTGSVLTYLALTLGVVWLVKRLLTPTVRHNIPPFPARPYPILGHLPYLSKGIREQFGEWTKQTGEMYSLYFGPQLVIILNGYDIAHRAFVKHADSLSDRPISIAANADGDDPNKGIGTAHGRVWKEQRSVALQILRSFGMGKNILALKIKEEVSAYLNALAEFNGEPTNIRRLTQTAVSNVICSVLIGQRFEYDDAYFVEFLRRFDEIFQLSSSSSVFGFFPWLRYLPGDLFNAKKRTENYRHIMNLFCHHYINKIKNEDNKDSGNDNFILAYLREKERLEAQGHDTTLDDENLSRVMYDLFLAGTDTTSTFFQWLMINLLHRPEIQEKIYEEIYEVVGTERAPGIQDKSRLNLLNAAIMETLRLRIATSNLPHQSNADTEINGYTIPAGAMIISNLDSVHRSADTYTDPTMFKPERFLDSQGNLVPIQKYMPFGVGRRACPGESMARMELFLFASALIQRFELQPETPGVLPSVKPVEGLVYTPQPCKIRFVERRGLYRKTTSNAARST